MNMCSSVGNEKHLCAIQSSDFCMKLRDFLFHSYDKSVIGTFVTTSSKISGKKCPYRKGNNR